MFIALAIGIAGFFLSACSTQSPYYDPAKAHRGQYGFVNPGVEHYETPFWEVIQRRSRGDFAPVREPDGGYDAFAARWRVPLDTFALSSPSASKQPRLVWLGHASTLLQLGGQNVLIDPHLSDFAGPLSWLASRRRIPAPIAPEALPPIDLVLITHNHYDHLDAATIDRLMASGQKPRFLVPLGLKAWFDERGIANVEELDWWDQRTQGPLAIRFLPAQHWSKRSLTDTNQSLWGGWAVEWQAPDRAPWRFVHTGDTAYNPDLYRDIRTRLGGAIDLLGLPIGAYEPNDFMRRHHVNPEEAVRLLQVLGAKQAFGIHWGVFEISNEAFDQPPKDLLESLFRNGVPTERVWLLKQGEIKEIAGGP